MTLKQIVITYFGVLLFCFFFFNVKTFGLEFIYFLGYDDLLGIAGMQIRWFMGILM